MYYKDTRDFTPGLETEMCPGGCPVEDRRQEKNVC